MQEIEPIVLAKRSATVVDTRPVLTFRAPYHARADLVADIKRRAKRGEIRPLAARPQYNERNGNWEWRVLRLRPEQPAWIKPTIWTGVAFLVLALIMLLGWLVLTTLAAVPLALLLIAAGGVLAGITRAGKPRIININQNVNVR